MRVHLSSNYPVGEKCREWLKQNLPPQWEYTENPDLSDCFFSIFSKKILDKEFIAKRPCWNFHLGILPKWKGTGIIPQIMIKGEKKCGISLHKMVEEIDCGQIVDVWKFDIRGIGEDVFNKSCDVLYEMFKFWAAKIMMRNYFSVPNKKSKIYTKKDMEKLKDITNIIKAFTFKGKEPAYWINSKGEKQYIKYE